MTPQDPLRREPTCVMCSDEHRAGPCFGPGRCFAGKIREPYAGWDPDPLDALPPEPAPRRFGCSVAVITLILALSGVPGVVAGEPEPTGEVGTVLIGGTLSYVGAKYGPSYLALPEPRGTVATICGPADCVTRRSTDYGPDQRVHPDRIADLSAADFVRVCGVPLSVGLCRGTVELEPPVSPDDDRLRVEDGGPTFVLPATDTAP